MGEPAAFLIGLFFGFFLWVIISTELPSMTPHYRQGQIDALTGEVRYELVDQPDGTREWVEIER